MTLRASSVLLALIAAVAWTPLVASEHGPRKPLIERFDTNHDGALDDGERATARARVKERHVERHAKLLERFDADHDGALDAEERAAAKAACAERFKEQHPKAFAHVDSDHDGQISDAERTAARARMHERRGEHGKRDDAAAQP